MPAQTGKHHERQVLQLANYDVPDMGLGEDDAWLYFRVLSSLRTFLQQDTVDITENSNLIEQDPVQNGHDDTNRNGIHHPYINLQHAKLPASAVLVHPERDVLWFSRGTDDDEYLEDMGKYYGLQLTLIENAIFEECEWDPSIKECLSKMRQFTGIRTIYVWLESYLYLSGEAPSTKEDYLKKARKLQARDEEIFAGRNVTVLYIDHERNIYGGFLA